MKEVSIYTDGSCIGNPGPGGWCAILQFNDRQKILVGSSTLTTNNAMEITAAIQGLSALKFPCRTTIHTDSMYLKNGMTDWIVKWKLHGWKRHKSGEIKNLDLWRKMDELCGIHEVKFVWVKAHNGDPLNELADQMARDAANNHVGDTVA
jgi:ribonuclease HI